MDFSSVMSKWTGVTSSSQLKEDALLSSRMAASTS